MAKKRAARTAAKRGRKAGSPRRLAFLIRGNWARNACLLALFGESAFCFSDNDCPEEEGERLVRALRIGSGPVIVTTEQEHEQFVLGVMRGFEMDLRQFGQMSEFEDAVSAAVGEHGSAHLILPILSNVKPD